MLVLICFIHFIADFLLQSRTMALKKSKYPMWLVKHCSIIFLCMLPFGIKFSLLNALIHGLVDWNLWNGFSLFMKWKTGYRMSENVEILGYKYWEDSKFYAAIGLDQFLHYATIILLWQFLN